MTPRFQACVLIALAVLFPAACHVAADPAATASTQVTGTVETPDGKPATNATVTLKLYDYRDNQVTFSVSTKPDSSGKFAFTLPLSGTQQIKDHASLLIASSPDGVAVWNVDPAKPEAITIEPLTSLRIHLQDSHGNPVPNIEITPENLVNEHNGGPLLSKLLTPQWDQVTDASGNATFRGLPQKDTFVIDVHAVGYAPLADDGGIYLGDSAKAPDQTYQMSVARTISGTLRYGSSNEPVPNVSLVARSSSTAYSVPSAKTDSSGKFKLRHCAPVHIASKAVMTRRIKLVGRWLQSLLSFSKRLTSIMLKLQWSPMVF